MSPIRDLRDRPDRDSLIVGDGKRLIGIDHVDAMQATTAQLGPGWFVGANVTVTEDLPRVHRDQLAVQAFGDSDRQLGLAAGRRPDDRHDAQIGYGRLKSRLNWSSGRIRVVGRPCGQLIGSSVIASKLSSCRADSGVIVSPKRTAL